MLYKQLLLILPIMVSALTNYGCGVKRQLEAVPQTPEEFQLPKAELKEKYPEVAVYSPKHEEFPFFVYCTQIDELVEKWGEPDNVTTQWWNPHAALLVLAIPPYGPGQIVAGGIFFGIYPMPERIYTWDKGNYLIEVNASNSLHCKYVNRVQRLKLIEKPREDNEAVEDVANLED